MNDFKLPPGYAAWCHLCGEAPFNKTTEIVISTVPQSMDELQSPKEETKKLLSGVGFKSMDEHTMHKKQVHQEWKG